MFKKSTHTDYNSYIDEWIKIRDVLKGETQVKSKRDLYLQRPVAYKYKEEAYNEYLRRAVFTNFSKRVLDSLFGFIFQNDPIIQPEIIPENVNEIINNIDYDNNDIIEFSRMITKELLTTGRIGILLDANNDGIINNRSYLSFYSAENILDWEEQNDKLIWVLLYEPYEFRNPNMTLELINRYRWLFLDNNNQYKQRIIDYKNNDNSPFIDSGDIEILFNGEMIDFLPFNIINTSDSSISVNPPPLIDIVNLNLSHFRNSADYELGLYKTATPFLTVTGLSDDQKNTIESSFTTGADMALLLTGDAQVNYTEFSGQGISSIRQAMQDKEQQIAKLGSRILSSEPRQNETAEAAAIHQMAESSILKSISRNISQEITEMVKLLLLFEDIENIDFKFELNTNFTPQNENNGD